MSKHTKGPWTVQHTLILGKGLDVCVAKSTAVEKSVNEANARLIAAAPEMLSALKLAMGAIAPGCGLTRSKVEEIIAKAEGGPS